MEFNDEISWSDNENDEMEDSGPRRREDLFEGGDFHLKSALKSVDDYMTNFIFKKEVERMTETVGSLGVLMSQIDIMLFWKDRCFDKLIKKSEDIILSLYLPDIWSIEDSFVSKVSAAELASLYPQSAVEVSLNKMDIQRRLKTFNSTYPNLWRTVMLLCFMIMMKNSLKSLRKKDITSYEGVPEMSVISGNLMFKITDSLYVFMNTDVYHMQVNGQGFWCPMNYFLNAVDKMQERTNVLLYTHLVADKLPNIAPTEEMILGIIEYFDDVLRRSGNAGYKDVAQYEALVVGVILDRDPDQLRIESTKSFLSLVINDLSEYAKIKLPELMNILEKMSVDQLADIHGLYRIWGHPIVNIDNGIKKMMSVSLASKITCPELSKMSGRKFKEIFFSNYRKNFGFYPLYDKKSDNKDNYLQAKLDANERFNIYHAAYSLNHWDDIVIKQVFEIPKSWNMIHSVKDKAISPNREELYRNLTIHGTIFNQDMRRVVLKTLNTPMTPMRDFLHDINVNSLDDKYCIIGIYAKERELKVDPRFFSLMSHELRLFVTATEELLNDKVLRHFPQITMSLNLLEMQKKMGKLSKGQADQSAKVTYVINMDFMKWNQQMRYDICEHVFKCLGQLFGEDELYNRTHEIFQKCTIYLSSGERPLVPHKTLGVVPDMKASWNNDGSGKEGLRQKGWTIMTVCDILYVADLHGIEIELVGGGDNQVITATFRSNDFDEEGKISEKGLSKIKEKMGAFYQALINHFAMRGLPLKSSETWVSSSLFMYNKHMYYLGRPLRTVLKQVSRCFPFANASLMSTALMCNSIGTILKAALQKEHIADGVITLKNIWGKYITETCVYLNPLVFPTEGMITDGRAVVSRMGVRRSLSVKDTDFESLWAKIMYLPSILGGPGMLNCYGLIMRGFPDSLTEGICFLRKFQQNLTALDVKLGNMIKKMMGMSYASNRNYEKLVEDPTAVSHDAPSHSTSTMRETAREAVTKITNKDNNDFMSLLNVANKEAEREFYSAICSGEELDPKVLHEIAKASLYGFTNSLLSRIDQTKTINRLNETVEVVLTLARDEKKYILYLLVRDDEDHDMYFGQCSRISAQHIRDVGWGKKILGVTVPHPMEYLVLREGNHDGCNSSYILLRRSGESYLKTLTVEGPCKPYYGSYTKERFKATDIAAAYGDEDILKRVTSLQKLIGWRYSPDSFFSVMIQRAFNAITNADPKSLWVDEGLIRGSYDHRRNTDQNTHGGIPNFLFTHSTHTSVCTSSWVEHSRSGKNETIHFQACIIVALILDTACARSGRSGLTSSAHIHECCSTCITELDEISPSKTEPKQVVSFPTLPNNKLVFINSADIKVDYSRHVAIESSNTLRTMIHDSNVEFHQDLVEDCVSTILLMSMLGLKTGVGQSFMLLARDKSDIMCTLRLLKTKISVMRSIYDTLIDDGKTKMIDLYCDTPEGYILKDRILNWSTHGNLEGGVESQTEDFISQTRETRVYINSVLGNVCFQVALAILCERPSVMDCAGCLRQIRRMTNMHVSSIGELTLCQDHPVMIKSMIRTYNIHPDNLLKMSTRTTDELMFSCPEEVPVTKYMITHDTNYLTLPSVDASYLFAEMVEVDSWVYLGCGMMEHLRPEVVVTTDDIETWEILFNILRKSKTTLRELIIVSKELSYSEVSVLPEKLSKLRRYSHSITQVWSPLDTIEDGTMVITVNKESMDSFMKIDGIFFMMSPLSWVLEGTRDKLSRATECYSVNQRGTNAVILMLRMSNLTYDMTNLSALERLVLDRCQMMDTGDTTELSLGFSTKSAAKRVARKFHFRSRYELISLAGSLTSRIGTVKIFERQGSKKRNIFRSLLYLYISLMVHSSDFTPEDAGRLRRIRYNPRTGCVIPIWTDHSRQHMNEMIFSSLFIMRKRSGSYLDVDAEKLRISLNVLSQRKTGLNIHGM
ncbi:MAG: putative RNA-dependent RNA polymerase [Alphanucleorhabdovirus xinjianensis]|uniref:RNA-directed RNA polymerase n=1 Tax=Xinjiang nucleorhabdovirus TaxID=2824629 RepID=A0AAE7WEA9_9RHAB|nr:MAG: putative RNA-dependent RNA polymerase [Xinjiang nucleorhabdovirus]